MAEGMFAILVSDTKIHRFEVEIKQKLKMDELKKRFREVEGVRGEI